MSGTSPVKIKAIAAQLGQQQRGLEAAGFVLEPGTMLNSTPPILHSSTLRVLINSKRNHVTAKALWPLLPPTLSLSP